MTPDPNAPESATKHRDATQGQSDDPRQAIESGEPQVEGRLGGRQIEDESGAVEGTSGGGDQPGKAGDSKDWESGRHQAR